MRDMNTPCVSVETAAGTREVPLSVRHRDSGHIFIAGEIDQEMAQNFLLQILYFEQEFPDRPVNVFINSSGGQVRAGMLMVDLLRKTKLTVNLICCGMAYSMAAVLLACGKSGRRFAYPSSQVMIHEPLLANGVAGSATNIREIAESIMKTRDQLNSILAEATGKSLEEINKATSFDNYMSAEEALQFGLIDAVLDGITV